MGTVKERVFTFLPKFELYEGPQYIGCISKEISFLKPSYNIDFNGWEESGAVLWSGTTPLPGLEAGR